MITSTYTEKASRALQDIFNCCPTVIQHHLLKQVEIIKVAKDVNLVNDGDICNGIYIVLEGSLKLYLKKEKQHQVILFKTVNELMGLEFAINKAPYNYSASAMEDSVLAFIPQAQIEKILTMHPNAFFSLMKKINEKALAMELRSSLMMTDSAEKVVIKTFEDLKNRFGTDNNGYIKIHLPVKDMASYVCMSKTNLYRVLQTLKEKTILTHHLDRYRLEKQ